MNYGKRKASKKQKRITSKKNMHKKKLGVRLFKGFLLCIFVCCILAAIGGGFIIKHVIDNAPEITADSIKPQGYTSTALADDGTTTIAEFTGAGANRVYKTIDQIPEDLQHAFVAIEDSRFYKHNGVDIQGIIRAFVVGITHGGNFSEGASTITQQLIKNNVFPDFVNESTFEEKLERKIQEQYLAIQVEKQLDKDSILESYLNTINLGQDCLGVQSAAQRYFNKDVNELNLSESATIAAITQNPGRYNPITNPEDNATRRKKVLDNMLDQGWIDQAAHDEALADDVYSRIQNVNTRIEETNTVNSYFVDALSEQLIEDLTSEDGLGYSQTQAENALYSGGLTIYSTQNLTMQNICDEELNDDNNYPANIDWGVDYALTVYHTDGSVDNYSAGHLKQFGADQYGDDEGLLFGSQEAAQERIDAFRNSLLQDGETYDEYVNLSPQPQTSLTIIDQKTGQIKALVGGRGQKTTNRGLNRAYKGSTRNAGSTFKILAVYAPALDSADLTLATTEVDEEYYYQHDLEHHQVHNWWGDYYKGTVTYRQAIEQSMNIIAVKTLNKIGINLGFEYCEKFGLSTLTEDDAVESLALGGISHGVYNYELTAAYASIANGGIYNKPSLYTKVLDHDGNVLIDNSNPESHTVIKDTTAALLTNAMQDVVTKGTATDAQLNNMPASGKSGTTSDNRDFWFEGFTPYYTCGIWMGYDGNQEMSEGSWNYHFKIWAKIMNRIDEALGLTYKDFAMPGSLVQKSVCTISGKLAGSGCPSQTEWFDPDTVPTETCSGHASKSTTTNSTKNSNDKSDSNSTTGGNSSGNSTGTNGDTTGGTGGDSGNTGGGTDSGNNSGNSGNTGGDSGNTGGDSGNTGGDSGNTGGGTDSGNTGGSDSGNGQ